MTSTILKGIAIAPGFAVARAFHIQRDVSSYSKQSSNSEVDLELFKNAVTVAVQQISTLRERVLLKMGPDKAQIFEAHLEMLQDPEYHEQIEQQIQKGSSVAESIARVTDNFFKIFQAMEDTYLRERGQDILDIGKRLKMICLGLEPFNPLLLTEPVVLVADEIMPSEVALFDREFIKAVVTEKGGITSHAAILLKNLEIPTIFGVKDLQQKIAPNIWVSVDGVLGQLELLGIQDQAPPEAKAKVAAWERQRTELQSIKDLPCKTKSGVEISLLSNLSSLVDAEQSKASGAIGVGLFRTEFLFSEKSHAPSEEEQFQIYKQLLQHFPQGKVVIRTMDIGGDKPVPYLGIEREDNPFLGLRGLRYCLQNPQIFITQLRALLRASVFGNLSIMFPMVSEVREMIEAQKLIAQVKSNLRSEGITVSDTFKVGMMIEVPAAALLVEEFVPHADFFSIGTNDLTQYVMAADRMNPNVNKLCDHGHPAVLMLVKQVIQVAKKHQRGVCICGELAGDERYTETLFDFGLREYSMSRSQLLRVKKKIIAIN